jgi:outer membrane lipoprotein-sorting protein
MDKRRWGGMVMRKILFCLLTASLLVTIPVLAACGTTPTTTTPTTTTPTTTTTTTEPGETLGGILERSAGISSVKYDIVITSPGKETQTIKVWVKGNKMRKEETTTQGETEIMLLDIDWDARTKYMYYPEQREYLAVSVPYAPAKSAMDEAQSIPDYAPTIIGHETLDGEACLVVKYTVVEYTAEVVTSKMWIWEQYGFPLRIETTTAEGKTIVEYKNIEFGDIPDSTFELPEGVGILDWDIWWAYPEGQ